MYDKNMILLDSITENMQSSVRRIEDRMEKLSYEIYMLENVSDEEKAKLDDLVTGVYLAIDGLK